MSNAHSGQTSKNIDKEDPSNNHDTNASKAPDFLSLFSSNFKSPSTQTADFQASSRPVSVVSSSTTRSLSAHSTLLEQCSNYSYSPGGSVKEVLNNSSLGPNSRSSLLSSFSASSAPNVVGVSGASTLQDPTSSPRSLSPTKLSKMIKPSTDIDEPSETEESEIENVVESSPEFPPAYLKSNKPESLRPSPAIPEEKTPETLTVEKDRFKQASDFKLTSEGEMIDGAALRRRYGNEDPLAPEWVQHEKHFLILSSAGKPIYSRYGDESKLSGYAGIIQAIISTFADDKDSIRYINAGQHKIIFLLRDPLYYVMVSKTNERERILRQQLHHMHHQVLSILTSSYLSKLFQKRHNYDLRQLLGGTEIFLDGLSSRLSIVSPSLLLDSIQAVKMELKLRQQLAQVINPSKAMTKKSNLVLSILVTQHQLIHLIKFQKVAVHPSDILLLFNMINSSSGFRISNQASWLPVCFPKFNRSGFLHALIYFLNLPATTSDDSTTDIKVAASAPVCLILLSLDKNAFAELSEIKDFVNTKFETTWLMNELQEAIQKSTYDPGVVGIPGLRHFLFKSKTLSQFTSSSFSPPFVQINEANRIYNLYQQAFDILHCHLRQLQIHFHHNEEETVIGWVASGFELYATFGPFVSKSSIIASCLELVKWINTNHEDLFITSSTSSSSTFSLASSS